MVLATLYMGGYLLSTNQLSAGQLMAYLMATQTIQRSLAQISLLFGTVVRGVAAGSRVLEVSIFWQDNLTLDYQNHKYDGVMHFVCYLKTVWCSRVN